MQGVAENAPLFDTGDKIALGAAIVAVLAMGIAIWQACEARKSRKATEKQADTAEKALGETTKQSAAAEKSATAAERSVGAAENQVTLARQAVQAAKEQVEIAQRAAEAAERSARAEESAIALATKQAHDAAAPKFEFSSYRGAAPRTEIKVTMLEGSALSAVTITPTGNNAGIVRRFEIKGANEEQSDVLRLGPTRKGESYDVIVYSDELTGPTLVALDVHCVPADTATEPWIVHETLTLHRPSRNVVLY